MIRLSGNTIHEHEKVFESRNSDDGVSKDDLL